MPRGAGAPAKERLGHIVRPAAIAAAGRRSLTMTTIRPESTIGELVAERPARSRVFESLKIDYCCGGKVSLVRA